MGVFSKIPFAIRVSDNQIVSIEDVPRGLACECRCPSCDARLIARKGKVNEHHFAHHDSSSDLCEFALETSIRLMLLETMAQIQSICTPDYLWHQQRMIWGRDRVELNFDIDLSHSNQSPHFVYKTPQNDDYRIGLYLPPAGQQSEPVWLHDYTTAEPKIGILQLKYRTIAEHLFSKDSNEYVTKLINIVQTNRDSLSWMYHPCYLARVQRYQQQEEKLLQEHNESLARQERYQVLRHRQPDIQLQQHNRLQNAYQMLERRPYGSNENWEALPECLPAVPEPHGRCRICGKQQEQLSQYGYCFNPSCVAARRKSGIKF